MGKPKVAFFDFTCCEGCQLQVLSLEDEILDLLDLIEIVNFREAIDDRRTDYDIAIIEGSITTPKDVERIKGIREIAKVLIAMGNCATTGGVNYLKNFQDLEDVRRYVYGDRASYFDTLRTMAVDQVVKVDAYMWGCPVTKNEVLKVIKETLSGRKFKTINHPVCVECRSKGNICLFDKGMYCIGPVIRAGCDALCPSNGNRCIGCRGIIEDPNINAHFEVLKKNNIPLNHMLNQLRMFDGAREEKGSWTKT